ncbi:hypothetical protein F4809DRAFT_619402 [Biscogniauxia mediterranea]|nr:hypothetical protein F4809DRAFT_619402 [Biscogniauxia mediterranea]
MDTMYVATSSPGYGNKSNLCSGLFLLAVSIISLYWHCFDSPSTLKCPAIIFRHSATQSRQESQIQEYFLRRASILQSRFSILTLGYSAASHFLTPAILYLFTLQALVV